MKHYREDHATYMQGQLEHIFSLMNTNGPNPLPAAAKPPAIALFFYKDVRIT
jgi:hypothetical protein